MSRRSKDLKVIIAGKQHCWESVIQAPAHNNTRYDADDVVTPGVRGNLCEGEGMGSLTGKGTASRRFRHWMGLMMLTGFRNAKVQSHNRRYLHRHFRSSICL